MTTENLLAEIEKLKSENLNLKSILSKKGIPVTKTDHDYMGNHTDGRCARCRQFEYQHNK